MSERAKGKRPVYFEDPHIDRLLAVVLALTGEVSVLRDRLDTIERLLAAKGICLPEEIESYQPSEQAAAAREQQRAEYIARVLRAVKENWD